MTHKSGVIKNFKCLLITHRYTDRTKELYKMHLIIALSEWRKSMGFSRGKATLWRVVLFFFFFFFKTSVCCFHRSPSKATAPFLLRPCTHPRLPSGALALMRATPESVITSRQWKVICRFTARWTGSIPFLQFSTFHEWKAPSWLPLADPYPGNNFFFFFFFFFAH